MLATANLNFSVLGFRSGLNLRYSTDQSRLRQDLNQFSFNAGWRWVQVSAGDVSPTFNRYSLKGTRIRGGEIELTPGLFSAHFTAGQINRRIAGRPERPVRQQSYERWLYGARLGVGSERRSHFHLGIVYARDTDDPLTQQPNSNRPLPLPEENLTVSPDFKISLFSQRFSLEAENTVSVFTRDLRSERLDLSDAGIPGFIENVYAPRTSTRLNFATNVGTSLDLHPFRLNLGFERVQPGFRSLGLRNIRDDQQVISVQPQLAIAEGRVNLGSTLRFGRDNLLNQRTSTQKRTDIGFTAQAQITNEFSLGAGYNRLLNRSETADIPGDEGGLNYPEQSNISQNFSFQPVYAWSAETASHSISTSMNYQVMDINIRNGGQDMGNTFFSTTGTYTLAFFSGLNFNTTLNYAAGDASTSTFDLVGANIGMGHSFFERNLTLNLNGGFSRNSIETEFGNQVRTLTQQQLNGNFTAMYRPTSSSSIRLTARTTNNYLVTGTGSEFQELEVRLTVDQRF
ncbi:MAG: hypothetical protein EA363_12090 [Balneolaceae bacterium]|nr:MAG: hypothetical protein EA363_12090 [Balneolaceae bacterium]